MIPAVDIKKMDQFTRHLQIVSPELIAEPFLAYKKIISDSTMLKLLKSFELFSLEWPDLLISYANYFMREDELHITIESGTKIIFAFHSENDTPKNTENDLLIREFITLKTYIDAHKKSLQSGEIIYLDARIPGKIFECSEKQNCYNNLREVYGSAYN